MVSLALRKQVLKAYGPHCYQCGSWHAQIDHVVPWALGGPTTMENLRPICQRCHDLKSGRERKEGLERRRRSARRPSEEHPSRRVDPS